jgi:hypothetical protein
VLGAHTLWEGRNEAIYLPAMLNKLKNIEIGFETSSKPICAFWQNISL